MCPTLCVVGGSAGSNPAMTSRMRAASSTHRVIGPTVSMASETGITPARLTNPRVGRSPTRLQADAGERIEFSVSLPRPATA